MPLLLLFTIATVMAIFGVIGYYRGTAPTLVALIILFIAFTFVELAPDTIITYLNGMYIGVRLVLKSGLSDIAAGDLESASEKLETIEAPFEGDTENLALLIVIGGAVLVGLLLGLLFRKSKSSLLGGALGLAYGYLLCAATLPLLFDIPAKILPVPPVRPIQTHHGAAQGGNALSALFQTLAQPENIHILSIGLAVAIALFLILTVRRLVKKG